MGERSGLQLATRRARALNSSCPSTAGHRLAQTGVDPIAQRQMSDRLATDIEALRVAPALRIPVGRCEIDADTIARLKQDALQPHLPCCGAIYHLHGNAVSKHLLKRVPGPVTGPAAAEPTARGFR